tara:strand:- start:4091 stop:4750 length:660 start_codon:yes stop_codon:yes gene_type:complete
MSTPVMIMGESGTGKSTSMHNLNPESALLIQAVKKPLPFRSKEWKPLTNDNPEGSLLFFDSFTRIINTINGAANLGKEIVVIDDFQYVLANEFMRRSAEKGFDKFTEIAKHAWEIILAAQNAPGNIRVYFLTHTENIDGRIKAKTIGKMLDEKITLEGLFTIVLKTVVTDEGYFFSTQNNGSDTVKSPMGLFEKDRIENDLAMIDNEIKDYYGIEEQAA